VLCSSSLRTRETARLMREAVPELPEPAVETGLYHASPQRLLDRLRALDDMVSSVMLVGHNPGLSALTRKLAAPPVRPRCARAFEHFPTAAAAVFRAAIRRWSDLDYAGAEFADYARPRELAPG
jgi:phosphohistidine phosphatase